MTLCNCCDDVRCSANHPAAVSPTPLSGCGCKKRVLKVTRVTIVINDDDDMLLGSSPCSPDAPRPYKHAHYAP